MRNDLPRLWRDIDVPGNETAALAESQKHARPPNTAPLCCSEGVEIVDEVKTSRRIPWGIVITAMIGIGFSLFLFGYARASEPPRIWVIWDEVADKQFHKHRFTSPTACNTDITLAKDGSGKRLACRRIDEHRRVR
jgi:hypothetical protein